MVMALGQARAETLAGAELVDALRQGGYVLLMRHMSSPRVKPDAKSANADNKGLERQLDASGVSAAREMGAAIRGLRIPIGEVLSSPTYRALETVRYAGLSEPRKVPELGDGNGSMQADADPARADWLRSRIAERPPAATNTIIITHFPNILGAVGRDFSDLADGEMLVIRPDGAAGPGVLARVKPDQWPKLASR
jgi:phosphohistidine phosphatase SixA